MNRSRIAYTDVARLTGTGLISTGVGLLLFVLITVTWGDPITAWSERGAQKQLEQQFDEIAPGTLAQTSPLDPRLTRLEAARFKRSIGEGSVAGRLSIPSIHLRKAIVKGAAPDDLSKGPGIYRETGFPGSGAPVAIAGHRTTHGAPFLNIDKIKRGDPIVIDMPYGRFTYQMTHYRIIQTTDWSIINVGAALTGSARTQALAAWRAGRPCPGGTCEHLVLTACHPKYSAARRYAVFARLVRVQLRSGSRR